MSPVTVTAGNPRDGTVAESTGVGVDFGAVVVVALVGVVGVEVDRSVSSDGVAATMGTVGVDTTPVVVVGASTPEVDVDVADGGPCAASRPPQATMINMNNKTTVVLVAGTIMPMRLRIANGDLLLRSFPLQLDHCTPTTTLISEAIPSAQAHLFHPNGWEIGGTNRGKISARARPGEGLPVGPH